MAAVFNIDGRSFSGRNIIIRNGVVTIDGVRQGGELSGVVEIKITDGVLERLETDAGVTCGNVGGDVRAGMEVNCGAVTGSVRAGMNVTCETVGGSVDAGMGVKMRR